MVAISSERLGLDVRSLIPSQAYSNVVDAAVLMDIPSEGLGLVVR